VGELTACNYYPLHFVEEELDSWRDQGACSCPPRQQVAETSFKDRQALEGVGVICCPIPSKSSSDSFPFAFLYFFFFFFLLVVRGPGGFLIERKNNNLKLLSMISWLLNVLVKRISR
jgi:hypothetical protein